MVEGAIKGTPFVTRSVSLWANGRRGRERFDGVSGCRVACVGLFVGWVRQSSAAVGDTGDMRG